MRPTVMLSLMEVKKNGTLDGPGNYLFSTSPTIWIKSDVLKRLKLEVGTDEIIIFKQSDIWGCSTIFMTEI